MLVVDRHTLHTIDILHLVDDVFLHSSRTLDGKDVCWCDGTIRKRCTSTHVVVLLHKNLLGQWHEILADITHLRGEDNFTVTTLHLTHCHLTVDFCNDGWVRWVTCLEQLGHTWETTRDIACLGNGTWNLDEDVTSLELLTIFHHNVTIDGE